MERSSRLSQRLYSQPVTVLADDLTGALDTAVQFSGGSFPVTVVLRPQIGVGGVLVADTESRGLAPAAAARAMESWVGLAEGLVYKKMDSTLRGPFAAEASVLAQALGKRGVLIAPAFPRAGRTVREGALLVRSVPVHRTGVGADPGWPVRDSRVGEAVRRQVSCRCEEIGLDVVRAGAEVLAETLGRLGGFVVADAETDADLAVLAQVLVSRRDWLPVGSAGLARALATHLGFAPPSGDIPIPLPAILVCGSAHPVARRQVSMLAESRDLAPIVVGSGSYVSYRTSARQDFERVGLTALTVPERRFPVEEATRLREELARLGADLVTEWGAKTLYATGGETLLAVLRALRVDTLRPQSEVSPGVVLSQVQLPAGRELTVVSKAGGFGDHDLLVRLFVDVPA